MQCHGNNGEGNASIEAPPIAGLPAWYTERQLANFMNGVRGKHFDDIAGLRMRPMARHIAQQGKARDVAIHVSQLPRPAAQVTYTDANAEKGKTHYATCAACHGADGKGNEALNAPPLVGSADWYIVRQLKNFKAGIRGAEPRDVVGATMAPMAMTLPDEQAMKDVAAYIMTLE